MKSDKTKWIVEIAVLAAIIVLFLIRLGDIFLYQDDSGGGFRSFYKEKEPIDVIFFGSSHAACSVDNSILWDDYGIASYTLSAGGQTIDQTYNYVKEALSRQHPEVIFVETYLAGNEYEIEEKPALDIGTIYRSILSMKFSLNYVDAVMRISEDYSIDEETIRNLILKWPIIHTRYNELDRSSYYNTTSYIRGYRGDDSVGSEERPVFTEDRQPVSKINERYINRIIDLCEENNVDVEFFCVPYPCKTGDIARQNTIKDLVNAREKDYISFFEYYDEAGIDFHKDLRDDNNHLNNSGATKVTEYLAGIIKNKYPEVRDRRQEQGYSKWNINDIYLENKNVKRELSCADFAEYIQKLQRVKDRYVITLMFTGDYLAAGNDVYDDLSYIGISNDTVKNGGAVIFNEGQTVYCSNENQFTYRYDTIARPVIVHREITASDNVYNDEVLIGSEQFVLTDNGVNIIVYDPVTDQVIDSCGLDVYVSSDKLCRN